MDFLCFYITSAILHKKLSVLRSFFASVAGGVYSVAILFAYLVPPFGLICDALSCALMCAFVFIGKGKKLGEILLSFAVYIGTSAALGGMMTALFNLLNTLELPFELLKTESEGIPVWLFALLAAASGAAGLTADDFATEFSRRVFSAICELEKTEAGFSKAMLGQSFSVDEIGRIESIEQKRHALATNTKEVFEEGVRNLKDAKNNGEDSDINSIFEKKRLEMKKLRESKGSK
jgi:hypothetical protein